MPAAGVLDTEMRGPRSIVSSGVGDSPRGVFKSAQKEEEINRTPGLRKRRSNPMGPPKGVKGGRSRARLKGCPTQSRSGGQKRKGGVTKQREDDGLCVRMTPWREKGAWKRGEM